MGSSIAWVQLLNFMGFGGSIQNMRTSWLKLSHKCQVGENIENILTLGFSQGAYKFLVCLPLAFISPFEGSIFFWQQDNSSQEWLAWELYVNMLVLGGDTSAQHFWLWTFCSLIISEKTRIPPVWFVQAFRVLWTIQPFFSYLQKKMRSMGQKRN